MNRKLLLAGLAAMTAASSAYAVPAYARQMNVSCTACHSSNGYPTLTRSLSKNTPNNSQICLQMLKNIFYFKNLSNIS